MVYNPKKNGVERSCPNPDCPTNHKPTKKAAKEPVNV